MNNLLHKYKKIKSSNLLLYLLIFFLIKTNILYAGKYTNYENPVAYSIRHWVSCTNHDITTLKSLEFNLPLPNKWPEFSINRIEINSDNAFKVNNTEGPGTLIRCFYDSNLPKPDEVKILSLSYRVIAREITTKKNILEKKVYPEYIINEEYKYYTRSETMIESNDVMIEEIAASIKSKTNGPYQCAKAAYDYVIDHIKYENPSSTWTAKECLTKGKGECGQYAALFVAICRAGGIPARPVAGAWCDGKDAWHCWAEFMLPEVGWIPADPTIGQQSNSKREYYFGNLDNNRLPLAKCFNMKLDSKEGTKTSGFIQIGTWFYFFGPGSKGESIATEFHQQGKKASNSTQKKRTTTKPR